MRSALKLDQIYPQMRQIWDFFRTVSVHFGAPRQNVLKLILKSPRFVPFLTKFGCQIWHRLSIHRLQVNLYPPNMSPIDLTRTRSLHISVCACCVRTLCYVIPSTTYSLSWVAQQRNYWLLTPVFHEYKSAKFKHDPLSPSFPWMPCGKSTRKCKFGNLPNDVSTNISRSRTGDDEIVQLCTELNIM